MKQFSIAFLTFILYSFGAIAQGHKITFQVKGVKDTEVQLGYYYGDKQQLQAKGQLNNKGQVVFTDTLALPQGLYLFVVPSANLRFDFLVDTDQDFTIRTNASKPMQSLTAKGSEVNSVFFNYQKEMMKLNPIMQQDVALRDSLKKTQPDSEELAQAIKRIEALSTQIEAYWQTTAQENKQLIISPLLTALNSPKPYEGKSGAYFFENIDLTQPFIVRTPILRETIMRVLAYHLNKKRPVSEIIHQCDKMLLKTQADSTVFQYTFGYMFSFFNDINRTGMNEVFVHLYEHYIKAGKTPWYKEEHLLQIEERVNIMRSNFVGETAFDLKMKNLDDEFSSLHDIESKYTIVYFWSVMCGHCKEATPHLKRLYDKVNNPTALEVYAVCTDDRKTEWEKQIAEKEVESWINVIDLDKATDFRLRYNVFSTPMLYLLDKDKKIIAKRLGPDQVKQIVDELMVQEEKFK